jgi:hypothetical protein
MCSAFFYTAFAMNVFIDTNILLSFFYLSGDDLEELKKLIVLLQKDKVKLWRNTPTSHQHSALPSSRQVGRTVK